MSAGPPGFAKPQDAFQLRHAMVDKLLASVLSRMVRFTSRMPARARRRWPPFGSSPENDVDVLWLQESRFSAPPPRGFFSSSTSSDRLSNFDSYLCLLKAF